MTTLPDLLETITPSLVHHTGDGIVVVDARAADQPIIWANPGFSALTGYTLEEVVGRNCRFLQHAPGAIAGEHDAARAQMRAALRERRCVTVVLRNFRKDGAAFWNELSIHPVCDASGAPLYLVGQQRDVTRWREAEAKLDRIHDEFSWRVLEKTADLQKANEQLYNEIVERQKAEHELRDAERKFRSIFENAVEGIYQSSPDGRYLAVNPALAQMYGYASPDEMLGAIGDIAREIYVDPAMRERFRELIERDGVVRNLEYQVRRRDGSVIWIVENARLVRTRKGRVRFYEGTVQDVTRRKEAEASALRLEQQLLQTQKMEAIGTLAGGIAHDFNNILGAIIGFTEMSLDDLPEASMPAENIRQALAAARRARGLVRQILAFSRSNASERRTLRLAPVITEALQMLRATLPATIRLEPSLVADDDHVIADAVQLHQVLVNLCTNAAHAMRTNGGAIHVGLDRINLGEPDSAHVADLPAGSYLRLIVRDTGHGMPPAVAQRIFEPFFTTKPVGEGTGLGLSVVHGIVKNHGGAITVESTPDVGTTFSIYLPAADAPAADSPTAAGPVAGRGERILVVDDEHTLGTILHSRLERIGYVVHTFCDPTDALRRFFEAPADFDVIITDHAMPKMSGLQLAQAMHGARPELPILLCSGTAASLDATAARSAGVRQIFAKPVDFVPLTRALAELLHPAATIS